jgi:membrane-associated phospholipid phosphatase
MRFRALRLLGAAAACMAAAAAVLLATYLVGRVARWDVAAFNGMRLLGSHHHVWWLSQRVPRLADPLPAVLILSMICIAGAAWGRFRHAGAAAALVVGGAAAGWALKALLAHPRYQSLLGAERLAPDAYPSGHATAAMSLALAAVLVTPKRWRTWTAAAGASYALAVGTALVINGWHYPSDVIGGFLVAACVGLLVLAALRATETEAGERVSIGAGPGGFAGLARPLGVLAAATVVLSALALSHAGQLLAYAEAQTSAVVAAIVIAIASVALVSGIAAEANGR